MKPKLYLLAILSGLLVVPVLLYSQESQSTQKRLALVIGNSDYQNAGYLMNPENDARDISQALRNTGFDVIELKNVGLIDMKRSIDQFGLRLRDYDVGLFYYAGHGIQARGDNYLVPVDATINTENDVEYNCVDVGRMLAKMEDARNKTNIIILDACRDNPFERSWSRSTKGNGLAYMNAPTGSLIAYATSPGTTASDGSGENGLYTSAILKHIYTEDQTIIQMFQNVRREVRETSSGTQVPWESTSLEGDFFLASSAVAPAETVKSPISGSDGMAPAATGVALSNEKPRETTASRTEMESKPKPASITRDYLRAEMSGIAVGDQVYFNRYASPGWIKGVILESKGIDNYIISYTNHRGKTTEDVIQKDHIVQSRQKRVPAVTGDIKPDDKVIFFTSFDKIISTGKVLRIKKSLITVQGEAPASGRYDIPLSAILILQQ